MLTGRQFLCGPVRGVETLGVSSAHDRYRGRLFGVGWVVGQSGLGRGQQAAFVLVQHRQKAARAQPGIGGHVHLLLVITRILTIEPANGAARSRRDSNSALARKHRQ